MCMEAIFHANDHQQGKQEGEGCTVMLAVGRSAADGRAIVAKNRDVAINSSPEIIILANSRGNNKYMGIASAADPVSLTLAMNDQGVIVNTAGRYCLETNNPGVNSGVIICKSIQSAKSAGDLAIRVREIVSREGKSKNGSAFACVDYREAYIVETYQKHVATLGPLQNSLLTYGNYTITAALKPYEKRARGYQRAKRARKLMEAYHGGVTVPLMMKICRDHVRLPDSSLKWDDYNICTHGSVMDTRGSGICVADREQPALLSILWASLNLPCRTPYLPFYMGMTRLPEDFSTARAYETFESLGMALGKVPAWQSTVKQYWEAFELQTMQEMGSLEEKVRQLAEDGKKEEAAELLTQFAVDKAGKALMDAKKITKKILWEASP